MKIKAGDTVLILGEDRTVIISSTRPCCISQEPEECSHKPADARCDGRFYYYPIPSAPALLRGVCGWQVQPLVGEDIHRDIGVMPEFNIHNKKEGGNAR